MVCCFCFSTVLIGQEDTIVWDIDFEDVIVTAQYAPTSTESTIHQVEVIKAEEWEARGQLTLSEVLQQQLNIRVNPDPILGNGITMQGLGGQNIQIMIDGVPVVGRLGGDIDLTQLNMAQFARAEIIMGAMSAQYGSNAAGGVINLISKQHQLNKWKAEASTHWEGLGIQNHSARLGRKFGDFQVDGGASRYLFSFVDVDSLRLRREIVGSEGETFSQRVYPWNPKEQWGYDANLTYRPFDSLRIRYGYRAFDEMLSLYGPIERPRFLPFALDEQYTTNRRDHHLQSEVWLGPRLYWTTTAGWNVFDRYKATTRLDIEPDTTSLSPGGQDTTRYTGLLVRSVWSWLGTGNWSAQVGIEYLRETGKGRRILDPLTNNAEPVMENMARWFNIRYTPTSTLTLEGNLRHGFNSRYDHPIVPSINLLWQMRDNWQWRASYARGFRAPSIQELFFNFVDVNHDILGNTDLEAENADNFRLSTEWHNHRSTEDGQLRCSAALFYNDLTNRITLVERSDETGAFTYGNLETYETHGINAQISWRQQRLSAQLGGAYTRLLNPTYGENTEVDRFVPLPELNGELSYHIPLVDVNAQLLYRYFGRQDRYAFGDDDNVILKGFVEAYSLVDISLQRSFMKQRLQLGFGLKNVFDQEQVALSAGGNDGAHSGGANSRLVAFGRRWFARAGFSF